ncbi:MAG: chemotaxis protein MotB [Reinekea sp.]
MSRLNPAQYVIFSVTFLVASLVANLVLFQAHATRGDQLDQANQNVAGLTQALSSDESQTMDQSVRLESMAAQQQDMAQIVRELQGHITNLNTEYQQTLTMAQQSEQSLAQSRTDNTALQTELQRYRLEQAEAQKTISNQLRMLRRSAGTGISTASTVLQDELQSLTKRLTPLFPDIVLSERAAGEAVLDIPLALIFKPASLQWVDTIDALLQPLATSLQNLPNAEILIIGHSDARPIVSAWAENYPSNWELSSARASKVVQYFVDAGVSAEHMTAAGKAANSPVRLEDNATAWQINRRLEIRISN